MSSMRAVHCLRSSTAGRVDENAGRDGGNVEEALGMVAEALRLI